MLYYSLASGIVIHIQVAVILILMSLQDFYQEKYYTFLAVKNDDA